MAFTSTQKANVRYYLGFQDVFRFVSSTLESQLSGGLSSDAETLVDSLLASLADIDAKILDAHGRLKALVVGSITLPKENEIMMLRSEGRRFVNRMAALFGVTPLADVFGDDIGGGSNLIPVG